MGQCHGRAFLSPRNDPVPIVEEAGWAPGPAWTGAENPFLIGIQTRIVQPVACRSADYAALAGMFPKAFFLRVKVVEALSWQLMSI
jgi:hypothetical protein